MRPAAKRSSLRATALLLVAAAVAPALSSCSKKDSPLAPGPTPRTYRMGFTGFPPRPSLASILQTIDLWSQRADAALILNEVPWDSLLAGKSPDSLILNNQYGLANYYRAKGLRVFVSVDPTNGLDRSSESALLVAAGRSLAEPAIQSLFRRYVTAMDTLVRPDYIGVASETNLIRAIAPSSLYTAVVQAADSAATGVRAHDSAVKIFTTVQVETAWGRLVPAGSYVGIAQDRSDFAFIDALGLSSYPYLGGFSDPDSVPLDYYSRLVAGSPLPMLVIEGGWSSDSASNPASWTLVNQRRYIARQSRILDQAGAVGWFQISFTDLDLVAIGLPPSASIFAYLGLVDVDFNPKPALSEWDGIFARPRQ